MKSTTPSTLDTRKRLQISFNNCKIMENIEDAKTQSTSSYLSDPQKPISQPPLKGPTITTQSIHSATSLSVFSPREATADEIKSLPHVVDRLPFSAWAVIIAGAAERFAYFGVIAPWRTSLVFSTLPLIYFNISVSSYTNPITPMQLCEKTAGTNREHRKLHAKPSRPAPRSRRVRTGSGNGGEYIQYLLPIFILDAHAVRCNC